MKRFRLFLIISALFCFLLLCLLSWLNFFYLPKKARVQVIQEIEKQTGLKVDLGRLSFHLLRGLTLEKLAFRDPKEGKLLFQADRLYVQCLWFPILLEKKFIASSVTFDHPALALTRFPDGRWNFQNFIEKMGQKSASTFFTPKISILRGELLFTDQTFSSPFAKHLKNVNAKMVFGLPVHIRFKVTFGLKESPAFLSATGSRSLTGGAWEVSLRAKELSTSDLAPYAKRYLPLIEEGKGDLSFEVHIDRKGTVSLEKIFFVGKTRFASQALKGETHCRLAGRWVYRPDEKEGFDYDFKAHLEEGIFQTSFLKEPFRETTGELLFTKDALSFRDVKATFGKGPVVLSGKLIHFQDPELDLTLSSTVEAQTFIESLPQKNLLSPVSLKGPVALETHLAGKMNALTIAGSLQAKDVLVKGIPYFGTLEHVHGPIEFTGNSLKTPGLSGFYQQFPFELSGTLTDFQNPILDLRLRFTKNLKELEKSPLLNVLPDNKRPSFSGTGQWDVAVKGSLKDPSARSLLGTCSLQNASLRTAFLPSTVESIDGKFSFDNKAVGWKGVTGNYAGNSFMLDGSFQPGDTPQIGIDLTTKAFELSSRFTLQGKDLRPFTLSQRTSRSAFTLQGEILNYDAPILKVSGEWKGTVEELQKLPFLKTKAFPGTNLEGRLITQFSLSGPKDRVPDITVEGRLSSDLLTWKKWRFKNLSTRYTYAQNTLGLSQFSSEVSQGRLLGKATVLFSDKRPYKVAMEARGVQLSEVIQMWTPDQKQFRGHLSGMFQGEGNFSQPKEVTGEGWVKIEEGDLFQIPILGGLKPVLRPIIGTLYPQLDTMITFQEAQAHYTLQNQSVSTDDLTLKGDRANLYGEGHVGFDQSLDFRVGVQFTDPEILQRPTDLSRLKNILISDTGMLAGEVRVTGTLAEPHYKYSPLPLQRIKSLFRETRDILFERLLE